MDLLEHSVRAAERFMGASLPTNYVGLLYEDAVHGSFAGTNFGTHIAILPKYDIDDGSHEAASAGSTVAHEVAHYYWSGNADWVDEGAAELMASIVDGARTGRPVGVTNTPCRVRSQYRRQAGGPRRFQRRCRVLVQLLAGGAALRRSVPHAGQ